MRRELLQRLFGTEIYDRVLDRLVEQRKEAKQSRAAAAAAVAGSIRAYCGAAGLDQEAEESLLEKDAADLTKAIAEQVDQLRREVEAAKAASVAAIGSS